jgi:hypothetical protein
MPRLTGRILAAIFSHRKESPIKKSLPSEEVSHQRKLSIGQRFPIGREFPIGRCLLRARASYPPAEITRATKTVIARKVVSPFFGRGRAASRCAHRRTLLPFENRLPESECFLQSGFRSLVYRAITANGRATAPQSPVGSSTQRYKSQQRGSAGGTQSYESQMCDSAGPYRLPHPPLSLPLPSSWLSPPWLSPPLSPSCCWF